MWSPLSRRFPRDAKAAGAEFGIVPEPAELESAPTDPALSPIISLNAPSGLELAVHEALAAAPRMPGYDDIVLGDAADAAPQKPAGAHQLAGRWQPDAEPDAPDEAPPGRIAACIADRHLIHAIAADRRRLEHVNDRLRARIAELEKRVAERGEHELTAEILRAHLQDAHQRIGELELVRDSLATIAAGNVPPTRPRSAQRAGA